MMWLLVVCLLARTYWNLNLWGSIDSLVRVMHQHCLAWAPTTQTAIHQALVCGEALPASTTLELLRHSALIHIVVVSGSHLILIAMLGHWCLGSNKVGRRFTWVALGAFTLMCGCQPPLVRSLLHMTLERVARHRRLQWTAVHLVLFSGVGCLILNPKWVQSPSLQLSWMASFALALSTPLRLSSLSKQTLLWLLMAPPLLPLAIPGPIGIFCNWLIAPLIGGILFPLSTASFLFPILSPLFSALWSLLMDLLQWITPPQQTSPTSISISAIWLYVCSLHLAANMARVLWIHFKKETP